MEDHPSQHSDVNEIQTHLVSNKAREIELITKIEDLENEVDILKKEKE